MKKVYNTIYNRHRLLFISSLCLFGLLITHLCGFSLPGPKPRKKSETKVLLLHADRLSYNQYKNPEAQILNGNVAFQHDQVKMFCDSAYFFKVTNSFEAFGHVRMIQGDTLSLTGDYLYYDGDAQIAQVRRNVKMKHRKSILLTDSLNYDRLYDLGYFFEGGKLIDGNNTLTSEWGEYSPATRLAVFNYNVKLVNPQFVLTSDTLHYDTRTKLAHIVGPSNIVSGDSHIYSESGYYNTASEKARLLDRSIVTNKGTKMVGDSLFYDKVTGVMKAFKNVIYEDKVNKNILTGNYCTYNELTGFALATDSAIARDYSSGPDTLFVHADTFKVFSYNMKTDSLYRVMHGYHHVRAYRTDVQAVSDSMKFDSRAKCLSLYDNPIVWNNNQQLLGEEIYVHMNDSTIDSVHVVNQALLVERLDSTHYNQVTSREMKAFFKEGQLYENRAIGNVIVVFYPFDSDSIMIGLNYLETSLMQMFMKERKVYRIKTPEASGTLYPLTLAPREKWYLSNFAWFDYIRPKDKNDLFEWREKKSGTELKPIVRRKAPLQQLRDLKIGDKK